LTTPRIGLLRERLAAAEAARVAAIADEGVLALLEHATKRAEKAAEEEAAFSRLAATVERDPEAALPHLEAYLRDTASSAELGRDLAALRRKRGLVLNVPALAERVALRVFRAELECEVALAYVEANVTAATTPALPVDPVIELARRPGRWSRRVEALMVLRAMSSHMQPGESRTRVARACTELAAPTQQRWVQPAALEVLFRVDAARAVALAQARFSAPGPGDDFLVRERMVELAGRTRSAAWRVVLDLAMDDPSEHVRLTLARVLRSPIPLLHLATSDKSEKVRAQALLHLVKRAPRNVEGQLRQAATTDPSEFVVRTAAECLSAFARRGTLRERVATRDALLVAAKRTDLREPTRAAVLEELAGIEVLADPLLRVVHHLLSRAVRHAPLGGGVRVRSPILQALSNEQIAQVLTVLSQHDFGISADRVTEGLVLYRGEARRWSFWRMWQELRSPLPSKRQGYTHSWGRKMRGMLRAPPRGLAELVATNVPGERVLLAKTGDWGRHLPLVDDLLSTVLWGDGSTRVLGPAGATIITPPAAGVARLLAWLRLSFSYQRYAEQRNRSLESDEPQVQRGFAETIRRETGIRLEFAPHTFARTLTPPREVPDPDAAPRASTQAGGAMLFALPGVQYVSGLSRDFLHYTVSAEGNRLPHVGAYAAAVLVAMIARAVVIRRRVDADRRAIPMVLGGWGTRGKSGTERIKAGLLQGLGYEILVKTTGCEAMFIHAIPGVRAQEVFIYRPYDKATIWEQTSLLRLGRRFGVRAFLWECMALQPDLVNLLHSQWMRDDYSTITNAYPDHEDVQGPAGIDVAQVISEFVPVRGRLFTAEDQMLPLLREQARARGTSVRTVGDREAQLIASDLLARFPYHEHPKNIALVASLGQALGVPSAVAITEMADHVVPDLGVLKTYPRVPYAGRSLAFTNGMSANERTGALSNWVRMGFDRRDDMPPNRRIVTVVNNRADRVARSEVFARFLVQDIGAHAHVLIGTNVSGLLGFLHEALVRHVAELAPSRDLVGGSQERSVTAKNRLERAFARLEIADVSSRSVDAEIKAFRWPPIDAPTVEAMLKPREMGESLASAIAAVSAMLPPDYSAEIRDFLAKSVARRRVVRGVFDALTLLDSEPARLDRIFAERYIELFEAQVVPLHDSSLTGDQVIDRVARSCPPGSVVDIMGVQNIKGTGLDFVYRWVSLDTVERALARVRAGGEDRTLGVRELLLHDDYGLVDATYALEALTGLHRTLSAAEKPEIEPLLQRLGPLVAKKQAALSAKTAASVGDFLRMVVGKTFDFLDSMRRQTRAKEVLEELVAGRTSHAAAAIEMRAVVARAKGAWAKKKATLG
jgi:poly-gamma-glutamate synthase PgsB/CapB